MKRIIAILFMIVAAAALCRRHLAYGNSGSQALLERMGPVSLHPEQTSKRWRIRWQRLWARLRFLEGRKGTGKKESNRSVSNDRNQSQNSSSNVRQRINININNINIINSTNQHQWLVC